jgi:hypothetical protein
MGAADVVFRKTQALAHFGSFQVQQKPTLVELTAPRKIDSACARRMRPCRKNRHALRSEFD